MTSLLCVQAHVGVHAGCHGSVLSCQRRLTLHEWRPVGYAYQPWLRGGVCADVTCMCVCVCGDGGGGGVECVRMRQKLNNRYTPTATAAVCVSCARIQTLYGSPKAPRIACPRDYKQQQRRQLPPFFPESYLPQITAVGPVPRGSCKFHSQANFPVGAHPIGLVPQMTQVSQNQHFI